MAGLPGLRAARVAAGLTQEEVAEKVGVSGQSIYYYESGRGDPSTKVLRLIASTLNVSSDSLLDEPAESSAEGAA